MKHVLFFLCLVLSIFCQTQAVAFQLSHVMEQNVRTVADVATSYIDLLNRIGASPNASYADDVESLFAPDCIKIVNGSIWFEDSSQVVPQLQRTAEEVGSWSIKLLDLIPGQDERTVVVRFLVPTEKGIWNTLVILRCNDQLQITEINEVFNNYEGA